MEALAKQAHTEELSKLVKCLSETRMNLGQIGELLKDVEIRIDTVEKKVGLDDDDLYNVSSNKENTVSLP